ncbi:hypothetical protein E3P94_02269 [Wallemia ichthyophaga]|nr:hypothetical protein E3P98_01473 [Wallemia ichthyophaga]TIA99008.1 hypothetical protein E3P95_02212 [Wallemia ichthyophaga]TIB00147.1 hypothetical protein E3P94_02269 [Wallemia ichthyophaga]
MNLNVLLNKLEEEGKDLAPAEFIDSLAQKGEIVTCKLPNNKAIKRRQKKKARAQMRKVNPIKNYDDIYIKPYIEITVDDGVHVMRNTLCLTNTLSSLHANGVSFNHKGFEKPYTERLHTLRDSSMGNLAWTERKDKYPKVESVIAMTDFKEHHNEHCWNHNEDSQCLMRVANQPGLLLVIEAAGKTVLAKWRTLEGAAEVDDYPSFNEGSNYSLSQRIPKLFPLAIDSVDDGKVKSAECSDIVNLYIKHNAKMNAGWKIEEERSLLNKPSIDIN